MLHVPTGANTYGLSLPSWGTTRPAAANGTSITPATGAYGSYAQVGSALSADAYGLLININSNYAASASRNTVVDIGVDEAGGTSFTSRIPDLICGNSDNYASGGRSGSGNWYFFPLFVPSGATLGARGWSTVATAFRVGIMAFCRPSNPSQIRKGSFVEAVGASNPNGTALTSGTTSEGSWTLLGTTVNRLWWWQLGIQVTSSDTSHTAGVHHVDLAVGDGSNYDIMILDLSVNVQGQESITNQPLTAGVEWDVPAGSNIYIRAQKSAAVDALYACAYGLGG